MPDHPSVDLRNERELRIEGRAVPMDVNDYRLARPAECACIDLRDGSVVAIHFRPNDHGVRVA